MCLKMVLFYSRRTKDAAENKRECWNWQTGKTKDLVLLATCGFKSHLPHLLF